MASSISKGAQELEAEMWKLPGLHSEEFFAAAYYLSVVQRQQKSTSNTPFALDSSSSTSAPHEIRNLFLDLLSLLFARFKAKSKTPANVTACAIIPQKNRWNILIAKNAGPYSPASIGDAIGDEVFAKYLQAWLNRDFDALDKLLRVPQGTNASRSSRENPGNIEPQDPSDQFWSEIVRFWGERITHYVRGIQNGANLLPIGQSPIGPGTLVQQLSFDTVEDFVKTKLPNVNINQLKEDWARVEQMSNYLRKSNNLTSQDKSFEATWVLQSPQSTQGKNRSKNSTAGSFQLSPNAFEECFQFRNRKMRQVYPYGKGEEESSARAYNQFRKRVKDLEMLGAPSTMWTIFNRIRDKLEKERILVDISFVPAFPEFSVERPEIIKIIKGWSGLEKSPHRIKVLQGLETGSTAFTKYFHCELQLLRILHNEEAAGKDTHPYIGVSKLSCHFCAEVLSHGKSHRVRYRTKDGHHQISANCAFPFDISAGYGYMPESLALIQASMLRNILKEAVQIKTKYTAYSNMDQTELASIPGSFASQSAQTSVKTIFPSQLNTEADGTIFVEGLKFGANGRESCEKVRLVLYETSSSPAGDTTALKKLIPECVKFKKGDDHWNSAGFELPMGRTFLKFEVHFRINGRLGNHPGNKWALKRISGEIKSGTQIDNALFRGDIWVFKVNERSHVRYQHIFSQRTADDMDFYEFQDQQLKDSIEPGDFFQGRIRREIESRVVSILFAEYELDQEYKKQRDIEEQARSRAMLKEEENLREVRRWKRF